MTSRNNKSVSLVLGSGGARGLAHIGIIEWLNDNGYDIQSISGSSMGALVGGIYAAGKLDNYRDWVQSLDKTDVVKFLDFSFSSTGLFKGDRIIDNLRKMVGNHLIEDLSIGFTAVATDLERQREVWFTRGPLFDAIRASIAVPTIFTPHKYKGRYLLDGGLLNPVPIAPTSPWYFGNGLAFGPTPKASPAEVHPWYVGCSKSSNITSARRGCPSGPHSNFCNSSSEGRFNSVHASK